MKDLGQFAMPLKGITGASSFGTDLQEELENVAKKGAEELNQSSRA